MKRGEVIDKLLFNNYSTISLGYAGLNECTKYMKGVSHTEEGGKEFALRVMQFLNDKCNEWKAETNIAFSPYGTPLSLQHISSPSVYRRDSVRSKVLQIRTTSQTATMYM